MRFIRQRFSGSVALRRDAFTSNASGQRLAETSKRHERKRVFTLLGLLLLLTGMLLLPSSLIRSSAQGGGARARDLARTEGRRTKASGSQVLPEAISNDTCATAIPLSLRQSVDGTLSTAVNDYQLSGSTCFTGIGQTATTADGGDAVYSFTAPATGNYSFKVADVTGAGDLVLYTASSCPAGAPPQTVSTCQMAANRNAVQASEEVLCQAMSAGQTVFIFVDEPSTSSITTFKIEVTQCQSETEANDTPATANSNIFGVEGTITPGTDFDYYSLGATVPGQRVFALVDGSAGNGSDFDLRVTTATDTLEYDDDNADFPFGNLAPAIAGRQATGTSTFLQVSSFGSAARQPYRLYALVEPPSSSAVPEVEPNDTIATANTSPLGYFSGNITVSTDEDFYSFSASAGDIIFAAYDADPTRDGTTVDGTLTLLDSSSNTLLSVNDAEFNSDNTSGAGFLTSTTPNSPAEAFVYRIQAAGTYYIKVNSNFGDTGDYLLAVSRNGFTATGPTAAGVTLAGRVTTSAGAPLAGVLMELSGAKSARTVTDSLGNYIFENLESSGFYTITPRLANYSFGPAERAFSLVANRSDAIFTAMPDVIQSANPLDTPEYFVRQQYLDFLGREPDEGGLNFWAGKLRQCSSDAACLHNERINVSAAFFMSDEFQNTASFVYSLYSAALGRQPSFAEFTVDRSRVVDGADIESRKEALLSSFVRRDEFLQKYAEATSAESFVDTLTEAVKQSSGVDLSDQRAEFIARYNEMTDITAARARVLRDAVETQRLRQAEYNRSFVLAEYFGYMRRDADDVGYNFWLDVLSKRVQGNYQSMVCAFLTSAEYQRRFSSVITRSNSECR